MQYHPGGRYAVGSTGALAPTSDSVSFGTSLVGKLAIVTGASAGIGKEVSRVLALRGAHVWMCGRSEEKATEAIDSIRHRMRTRRCHQSSACCSCRKPEPCPGVCCGACQLQLQLIEDMRLSIGDKADNLEWREVHLDRMFSVRAFVDEIEATVKDFHVGSPARVVMQPVKKPAYEGTTAYNKRILKEAKEAAKANKTGKKDEKKSQNKDKNAKKEPEPEAWVVKQRPSFSQVDLLYLNAGVFEQDVALTVDGHEYTHQVNYLAHFYIAHEMIARGLLAADARIIITQTENALEGPKRSWPKPDKNGLWAEVFPDPAAKMKEFSAWSREQKVNAAEKAKKKSAKKALESKKMLVYMQVSVLYLQ